MTADDKNRCLKLVILVLFYMWEDTRNQSFLLKPIIYMYFKYPGFYPVFPLSWISLRLHHQDSCPGWWLYGRNISCFLKWQVTFFFCTLTWYYSYCETTPELFGWTVQAVGTVLLLLLSRFSRVRSVRPHRRQPTRLPTSLGFSRQEHRSGLPFPSPMHESEKWKWSRSVMSNS